MPVPWLLVLKSVPWTDVIKSAPKVAEGARKLWNTVGSKSPEAVTPMATEDSTRAEGMDAVAAVEAQLEETRAAVNELHEQMMASSELIKALADQNAMLVGRIEANRVRLVWLTVAMAPLGLAVIGLAVALLS